MIDRRILFALFLGLMTLDQQVAAAGRAYGSEGFLLKRHLVDVGDGRRLNLVCAGTGSPTLVFLSGSGANLLTWQKIAGQASAMSRSCFYERAGYGYSDPSRSPSTAAGAAEDLHRLLRAGKVAEPVVLVGHSLGGLVATVFADRYRDEVAGLVLIDPSFAGQDKAAAPEERVEDAKSNRQAIHSLKACAALARQGSLATEPHVECFEYAPGRTAAEKAMLSYAVTHPALYEAQASEIESMYSTDGVSDTNSREEFAAGRSFGAMPIVVLTAPLTQEASATPAKRTRASAFWANWKARHDELAARSSRGRSILVTDTSHFIQLDQPAAVLSAIEETLAAVRTKSKPGFRRSRRAKPVPPPGGMSS